MTFLASRRAERRAVPYESQSILLAASMEDEYDDNGSHMPGSSTKSTRDATLIPLGVCLMFFAAIFWFGFRENNMLGIKRHIEKDRNHIKVESSRIDDNITNVDHNQTIATEISNSFKPQIKSSSFHVFQIGMPHTSSTLLNNILQGLLENDPANQYYSFLLMAEDAKYIMHGGDGTKVLADDHIGVTRVTKTHIVDVDYLMNRFGDQFDKLYFVASGRSEYNLEINKDVCQYRNVLCLESKDYTYYVEDRKQMDGGNLEEDIERSIIYVKQELERAFPILRNSTTLLNVKSAIERTLQYDNARYTPFYERNYKLGIHMGLPDKIQNNATATSPETQTATRTTPFKYNEKRQGAQQPGQLYLSNEEEYCGNTMHSNVQNKSLSTYKCLVPAANGSLAEIKYYTKEEISVLEKIGEATSLFPHHSKHRWIGREMNRIMSIAGAAMIARACGLLMTFPKNLDKPNTAAFFDCVDYRHLDMPPELQMIRDSSICHLPRFIREKRNSLLAARFYKQASDMVATEHPYEWKQFGNARTEARRFALAYLGIREGAYKCTKCSEDELNIAVAHIRSGDVFRNLVSKRSAPDYKGQPPLDFYVKAIRHSGAKKLLLITEDDKNPVSEALSNYNWTSNGGKHVSVTLKVGRAFDQDLRALFCGRTLITGNTSLNSLAAFAPNVRRMYVGWVSRSSKSIAKTFGWDTSGPIKSSDSSTMRPEFNVPSEREGSTVLLERMSKAETYGYIAPNYSPYTFWKGTPKQLEEMINYSKGFLIPIYMPRKD